MKVSTAKKAYEKDMLSGVRQRYKDHRDILTKSDDDEDRDRIIEHYTTQYMQSKYKAGAIPTDIMIRKALRAIDQVEAKQIAKIQDDINSVFSTEGITINAVEVSVDWVRSSTWGLNPHATVTIHYGGDQYYWMDYMGTASGCGYDKLSTAIASAINQSAVFRRDISMLYLSRRRYSKDRIPCGISGSSWTIPHFEGGTGFSSFDSIMRELGFNRTSFAESKNHDYYLYKRKK